jgi:Glycosyltransferase family 87
MIDTAYKSGEIVNDLKTSGSVSWQSYFALIRTDYNRQPQAAKILILVALSASLLTFAFDSVRGGIKHEHMDLNGYLVAASLLHHGGNPYDPVQGQQETDRLHVSNYMPMTSPIAIPLFYGPVSRLSLARAGYLWALLNPLMYTVGILLLLKTYCKSAATFAAGIFVAAIHSAFHLAISLGQISPMIFLLMATTVVAAERHHWIWAALFAAVATSLKAYPVALVAGLWWIDRKAFFFALIFTIIGVATPALFVPHHIYFQSLRVVAGMTKTIDPWAQNQSIAAMWFRLLTQGPYYVGIINSPKLAWFIYRLSSFIGLVTWLITCFRGSRRSSAGVILGYTIVTSLLFATVTWEHYLEHSLIVFFAMVCYDRAAAQLKPWLLFGAILATIIVAYPFDYADEVVLTHGILTLLISAKMFGMLLLWLVCTIQINRLAKTAPSR